MYRGALFLAGTLIAIGTLIAASSGRTNCGGNNAALSRVGEIAMIVLNGAANSPNRSFDYKPANPEEVRMLSEASQYHWCPGARFLVTTDPVTTNDAKQRVIVVCDTPYRNVPQRLFGKAPPTHAAAYSDGTTRLISCEEFAGLDRSKFVPLDELFPPDSTQPK
jgi:hypothetical protein